MNGKNIRVSALEVIDWWLNAS